MGPTGKVQAELAFSPDGSPALRFYHQNDKPVVELASDASGTPRLAFYERDRSGQFRIGLGLSGLNLADKEGNHRAGLWLTDDGSPRLSLSEKDGKRRIMLMAGRPESPSRSTPQGNPFEFGGTPTLAITDWQGKPRAILGTFGIGFAPVVPGQAGGSVVPITTWSYGPASLLFFDQDCDQSILIQGDIYPGLTITNKNQGTKAALGVLPRTAPAASGQVEPPSLALVFQDQTGKETWKAP